MRHFTVALMLPEKYAAVKRPSSYPHTFSKVKFISWINAKWDPKFFFKENDIERYQIKTRLSRSLIISIGRAKANTQLFTFGLNQGLITCKQSSTS